jgi:hypothetical protein
VARDGYVDPDGNLSPSIPTRTATVSGSGTSFPSQNPFQLGDAGAINASFTANNGALNAQQAPSLSVSHAGRALPLITTPASPIPSEPTTFGPITTTETLFPFTTGYTVWAGKCAGEQPPAGGDRVTNAIVGAGQLNVTVKEPAINLRVYYPSFDSANPALNRRAPIEVRLRHTSTASGQPNCVETWYPPVRTDIPGNSTSSLVSPGQPYAGSTVVGTITWTGRYEICASYDTNGGASGGVMWGTLTNQQNTNFGANNTKNLVINLGTTCFT